MNIIVRGKNLTIDDEMASVMKKNFIEIDTNFCEDYVDMFYTKNENGHHIHPDLNYIFSTKTEAELSNAVNSLLKNNMEMLKY